MRAHPWLTSVTLQDMAKIVHCITAESKQLIFTTQDFVLELVRELDE